MPVSNAPASQKKSLLIEGFKVQLNVIGALLMRELHTRFGRENIGYIWLILEPLILASVVTLLHTRTSTHFSSDIQPVPFALVGYCNFIVFRSIFTRADGALESSQVLLYHQRISIFDILFARSVLDAAGANLAFFLLMGLAYSAGFAELPERPLMLLLGMLCMFLLSFGLALLVCTFTYENTSLGRLIHPLSYLLLPIGGTFFPMEIIPMPFRYYLSFVPLTHIFELLRYGQFRSATNEFIDPLYLGGWIGLSLLFGLLAVSHLRSKLHGA